MRAREAGITIGEGTPGRLNAITDVAGVRVGHTTLIEGEGPLQVGRGPVRTGVTVVIPPGSVWLEPLEIGADEIPTPGAGPDTPAVGSGSIIVVVATDAPLLPMQCDRLAQRAGLGVARTGGVGEHTSGDLSSTPSWPLTPWLAEMA